MIRTRITGLFRRATRHHKNKRETARDTRIESFDAVTHDALLDAAPDAIIVVDTSGAIVLVNAQAERVFGWSRHELVGRAVETLVPEGARAGHPEHRAGYVIDPHPRPMGAGVELAARRKDGTEFPAEISLSAIDTKQGMLVAAAVRDVTERRRAEAKFRGLLEAAPDAIVGVGADGRIALVNGQTERLFGYGRDELIGQPVEILVPDAAKGGHPTHRAAYFSRPVTRPMGAGVELAARRKDGSEFPAEISLSSIETEDGVLVSAAIRDGTVRKQAAIISSSNDAIISQTLDGTVTSWNPARCACTTTSRVDVIGRSVELLMLPEYLDRERSAMARAALGERTPEYETVRVRADGNGDRCRYHGFANSRLGRRGHGRLDDRSGYHRTQASRERAQVSKSDSTSRNDSKALANSPAVLRTTSTTCSPSSSTTRASSQKKFLTTTPPAPMSNRSASPPSVPPSSPASC